MFQTKNLALNPAHGTEIKTESCESVGNFTPSSEVIPPFDFDGLAQTFSMSPCFLFPMLALILLFNVPLALSECMECKEVKFNSKKLVTF